MADEGEADNLGDDMGGDLGGSKKASKGALPQLLKFVLIGIAAVIFIVTIVVITFSILNKGGGSQTNIPVSEEYTTKRESYDWYTSLDQIRTSTSDKVPASVSITIALGYKKEEKAASTEITERRIEIIDFLSGKDGGGKTRIISEYGVMELDAVCEYIHAADTLWTVVYRIENQGDVTLHQRLEWHIS